MPYDIFLSYRRSDQAIARALVTELEARGVAVWWDQKIEGGEDWRDAIVAGLEASGTLVILFSEECNESKQLKKELAIADTLNKLVIPILIEDTKPKGHYLYELAARNWIQVFPNPASRAGDLAERLARELGIEATRTSLSDAAPKAQAAPEPSPPRASVGGQGVDPAVAPAPSGAVPAPAQAPAAEDVGSLQAQPQPVTATPAARAKRKASADIVREKVEAQREQTDRLKTLRDFLPLRWIDIIPMLVIAGLVFEVVQDEWYVGNMAENIGVGLMISAIALGAYGAIAFPIRYYLRRRRFWRTAGMQALNSIVPVVIFVAGLMSWWEGDISSAFDESFLFIPPVFLAMTVVTVLIYGVLNAQRALRNFRKNVEVL